MNENRSFLVTLLLTVGAGAVIGLLAFGVTGNNSQPVPSPDASTSANANANANASAPSESSPSSSEPEPMAPVQYDSPDAGSTPAAPPPSSSSRPVLM
jgi:hypothetical protein